MSAKAKRSMISEGILAQIGSIGAATDELTPQMPSAATPAGGEKAPVATPERGKKLKGRPPRKPPCTKITLELPTALLEHLQDLADERTGGNRTMLIERVLSGQMTVQNA